MRNVVLISDPRVTSIPVEDCGEPLADIRGVLAVDDRLADPGGAYAHLRAGLLTRLREAESALPYGYRLRVVEGYRPPALQIKYFEDYKDELRTLNPAMSPEALHTAASRYVSPLEVAPHTAGAAVDLTLTTDDGTELDMGTEVNATPEQSDGACYTAAPNISPAAREHRKILTAALESAGLVNYPTEWWHWSHGDRYWAHRTHTPAAIYGPLSFLPS